MDRRNFVKYGFGVIAVEGLVGVSQPAHAIIPELLGLGKSGQAATGKPLYESDLLKWLYIGWENDHPKSWTFMGGGVAPGLGPVVQYTLTIDGKTYFPDEFAFDRKTQIQWFLRDEYLPCPVSMWKAGPVHVEIQHFANRMLNGSNTAVYSRIHVTNTHATDLHVRLNVNAGPEIEIPLSGTPSVSGDQSMHFDFSLRPGKSIDKDFVSLASGPQVSAAQLSSAGSFDSNYAAMSKYWHRRMASLAEPVQLPVPNMVAMYKAIQIMVWENMVKNGADYEIHAAPRNPFNASNYDRPFSHDAPNYVDEFAREGDYTITKRMLASAYFKAADKPFWKGKAAKDPIYEDTLGKYILPYSEYLRGTGDLAYFTPEVRQNLKRASRIIHSMRNFDDPKHYGLMKKSQDFENWADNGDYLLCDNWSALHGLQAYKYICERLGEKEELQWVTDEITDLNDCVNKALNSTSERRGTEYYVGAFDDVTLERYEDSLYSWVPYSGALSTFPWGAYLKGFNLGGFWKERLDASIQYALAERDRRQIPHGSWGTWWGHVTYGTAYNCSAGLQCLYSDKYRTEVAKNLEFQLANQCAPYNWSEAFEYKGRGQWVGMYLPPESYGNLDSWGASFTKQALLQVCASVKTDGTVIIGRGIPDYWLAPGSVVEWANVNVNDNRTINFRITANSRQIELKIWGDVRNGNVHFNLPVFQNNIAGSDTGIVDNAKGVVILSPTTNSVVVKLVHPPATKRPDNERVEGPDGRIETLYPKPI